MKKNILNLKITLACGLTAACLAAPSVRAGTVPITFGFQKGNLTTNSVVLDSGYLNVVDGRITDNSGTAALSTGLTATIGNQFLSAAGTNGQQHVGLFSYDLTALNNFIAANTGPNSSVSIASVSMTVVSAGGNSGGAQNITLFGTDPFTAGSCTWSNYTTATPWTVPFQNLGSPTNTAAYCYTGGGSALTPSLAGSSPNTGVTAGNTLTWTSSANFINAVTNALARADKTLYLTARVNFLSNGDARLNIITSATNTVAFRPQLQITVNVTPVSRWTGGADTSWTTLGNWLSGTIPATDDLIIFDNNSTANLSTVLNQNFSVTSISVANPSGAVSIGSGGGTLTNGAGGIDLSAATQDLSISAPVVLGTNQSWNVGASRTLSVNGGVSGSAALTVSGAGKVSLGGAATHTGNTTVSAGGTLQMGAANVLPNLAGGGNVNVNGVLDLNANAEAVNGLTGSGVVENTAVGTASLTVGSNNTNSTFSGTIQNTGGALALVKTGTGTATLNGTNTYSGGTTINGGAIAPGNNNAIGTGTLTVNSGGIFYPITGSPSFTNAVTLNGGTLEVGGAGGRVLSHNGPVTVTANSTIKADGSTYGVYLNGGVDMSSGGYTLSCNNGTVGNGNQISGITGANGTIMNSGIGNLWITGSNTFAGTFRATNSGPLIFSSVYALQNATLDMNAADIGAVILSTNVIIGALTGSRDLNLGTGTSARAISIGNNNANTTYSGALTNGGSVTKIGTGTLTLAGTCTYTGKTTISGGTLALSGSGSIASANIIMAGGARLDVSGLSSAFALAGRTLTNSSVGAALNGANNCSAGTLSLVYDGVNPSFIQTNGTMTLSASTVIQVNNTGISLTNGSYTIIAAATAGNVGSVTGPLPAVTVTGNGAAGTATLQINGSGGLDLVVTSATPTQAVISSVVLSGSNLILQGTNGAPSGTYSILTSTNVALPLSSWTTNTSGTFTAGGAFSNAIPVTTEAQRFFLIKQP